VEANRILLFSYGSQIRTPALLWGFLCGDVDGLGLRNQLRDF